MNISSILVSRQRPFTHKEVWNASFAVLIVSFGHCCENPLDSYDHCLLKNWTQSNSIPTLFVRKTYMPLCLLTARRC